MKKLVPTLCLFVFLLSGCNAKNVDEVDVPTIDQHLWTMASAQSVDAEGQIVAYGPDGNSTLDTAIEVVLTCSASEGVLVLNDETNEQTHSGVYKLTDTSQDSLIYEVTVGKTEGVAVVSMTTYHDESQLPTLIIRLGDYALNLYADSQ